MDFEDHSKHTWHEKHVTREDIRKSEKKKLQMEPKVIAETQVKCSMYVCTNQTFN